MYEFVNIRDKHGFAMLRKQGTIKAFSFGAADIQRYNRMLIDLISEGKVANIKIAYKTKKFNHQVHDIPTAVFSDLANAITSSTYYSSVEAKDTYGFLSDDVVQRWYRSGKSGVYNGDEALNYYKETGNLPHGILDINVLPYSQLRSLRITGGTGFSDMVFVYDYATYENTFETDELFYMYVGNGQYTYFRKQGLLIYVEDLMCQYVNVIDKDGDYDFVPELISPHITYSKLLDKAKETWHIEGKTNEEIKRYIQKLSLLK